MENFIQTYLPNVYRMGWSGQAGWGTAIYLTLYMTVISFIIGGLLGLIAGLFLVLTAPGGVLEIKQNHIYLPCYPIYYFVSCSFTFFTLDCGD